MSTRRLAVSTRCQLQTHQILNSRMHSVAPRTRPALHPQGLCKRHVEKKSVHIDSRTPRAMGRHNAPKPTLLGHAQAGQRKSCQPALQHAGRVSVMVSKLAPPSPPRKEAALWAIASCDTLSRAPDCSGNIPANNLRQTCEACERGGGASESPCQHVLFAGAPRPRRESNREDDQRRAPQILLHLGYELETAAWR